MRLSIGERIAAIVVCLEITGIGICGLAIYKVYRSVKGKNG